MPTVIQTTTIDDIITALETKCKVKSNPDTVIVKLNATKQNGDITKFTDTVEKLVLKLEKLILMTKYRLKQQLRWQ